MKKIILPLFLSSIFVFQACEKPIVLDTTIYDCNLTIEDDSSNHPKNSTLQKELDNLIADIPGIQASIIDSTGLIWSGAAGMADIPNNVTMKPCTKTMVGSISKVFTAVMVMQLQDDGLLNINDPLKDYLSGDIITEIPNADKVTIQQLLNHTTGIPDYLNINFHVDAINEADYILSQRDKMKLLYGKKEEFAPGDKHSYSNSNYVLLGILLEELRKMSLWNIVDEYIVDPLNLKNTLCGTEMEPIPEGTARPYLGIGNGFVDIHQNSVSDAATGDGGISSCAQDLNIFFSALLNGQLVSDDALEQMKTLRVEDGNGDRESYYGLGLDFFNFFGGESFGHSGSTSTYLAYLLYIPEKNAHLALCVNGIKQSEAIFQKIEDVAVNLYEIGLQ